MKTSSAKAKGRRLQGWLRDRLLAAFPSLLSEDVRCAIMGERGDDLKLSRRALELFDYAIECKNVERLNIWDAIRQVEARADGRTPLVVFARNRTEPWAALPAENLIELHAELDKLRRVVASATVYVPKSPLD